MLSGVAFVLCAGIMFFSGRAEMQKRQIVWLLLSPAVLDTLCVGQDYAWLLLLATLAWWLERRGRLNAAAVCIGLLAALKPNMLTWPGLLFLAGERPRAGIAFGTFAAVWTAPLAIYGPKVYAEWFAAYRTVDHSTFPRDTTLIAFFTRLGARPLGECAAIALLTYVAWLASRKRLEGDSLPVAAICAAILCSTLAWTSYSMLLAPWITARRWRSTETAAAATMMLPFSFVDGFTFTSRAMVALGSMMYIEGFLVFLWRAVQRGRLRVSASAKAAQLVSA